MRLRVRRLVGRRRRDDRADGDGEWRSGTGDAQPGVVVEYMLKRPRGPEFKALESPLVERPRIPKIESLPESRANAPKNGEVETMDGPWWEVCGIQVG